MGDGQKPARRNAFKEISRDLESRIRGGEIGLGRMLPTERELQTAYGVSRSTVRRALAKLIDDGWARLVPNRGVVAAPGFAGSATTRNIAFIDGRSYVQRMLSIRMTEALRMEGYHLIQLDATGSVALEDAIEYCVENSFAGAIVWPSRGFADPTALARLSSQIPLVFLWNLMPGANADFVTFDHVAAAESATQQLIDSGCHQIGVTGMLDMYTNTHDRFSGYLRAMFANLLQPQARDYCFTYTSGMMESDTSLLERRLADCDAPDGLLILQDLFVPPVIEAALRAGRRIPDDLKICTVGDDLEISVDGISMSAVALDWDEAGRLSVELLMDRISNPTRDAKTAMAPHQLIVRGLCGSPPDRWTPNPDALSGFHGNLPIPRSEYRYSSSWSAPSQAPARNLKEESQS